MQVDQSIIKKPLVTERSTAQRTLENKYSFRVAKSANKIQIAKAIQDLFNVKVLRVHTMNVKGKKRRMGRYEGMKPDWKKAIVTLKAGDSIKSFEGA